MRSAAALLSALDTVSFRIATLFVAPAIPMLFLSFIATKSFSIRYYFNKVLLTFLVLELLLGKAELVLGLLEALL